MQIDSIREWERKARRNFVYKADGPIDQWRSHAVEVLQGLTTWYDDCDGLASTCLDLCGRDGSALEDRFFLEVMSVNGGHAVGCIADSTGKLWIIGDTFGTAPYPVEEMKHKPIQYHRLSEDIKQWRDGVPWEIVDAANSK